MTPGSAHECMLRLTRWLAGQCKDCPWRGNDAHCERCPARDARQILAMLRDEAGRRDDGSMIPKSHVAHLNAGARLFVIRAGRREFSDASRRAAKSRTTRWKHFKALVKHGYLTLSDDGGEVGLTPKGLRLILADRDAREHVCGHKNNAQISGGIPHAESDC